MDKNELKKYTVREIKAMLASEQIVLQDLDTVTLEKLMDYETDMLCFGKGDVDLISECADILCQREKDIMSHDEFTAVVDKSLAENVTIATKNRKVKKFSLKRALIIAATVATLLIGSTFVASAFDFDLWDYICDFVRLPNGTIKEANGLTFYNAGTPRIYSTIQEAIEKENLDIMYPASMPDGVEIESVEISNSDIGDKYIDIIIKNTDMCICIITELPPTDNNFYDDDDGDELYEAGGVTYKLFERDIEYTENTYWAYCNVDNCAYSISARKYEDLIFVINNMKEK